MNHVFGTVGNPNLCFPSDFRHPLPEFLFVKECGHENWDGGTVLHLFFQFPNTNLTHWSCTMDGFYQEKQILFATVCHNIGQFFVFQCKESYLVQCFFIFIKELVSRSAFQGYADFTQDIQHCEYQPFDFLAFVSCQLNFHGQSNKVKGIAFSKISSSLFVGKAKVSLTCKAN